jgi:hypothetical protein
LRYKRAMTIRHLLLASLVTFAACGGSSKKPPAEPASTEPAPTETAQTPPVEKAPPVEAPAPPPPPPKFALGDAKITMKSKSKTGTMDGEVALAADGTLTATMNSTNAKKKKETKTIAGKLTAAGELQDDKGEVIARLGDGGKVETRQIFEEKADGKLVKSETKYEDVGTLDDEGVFTNKKDGKTFSVDAKGKLTGFPAEMQLTVTSAPEQRKAAVFVVVAMFAASKMTTDSMSSKAAVPVPAPKK